MTSLPFYEQVLIIAICAGATILTRLLPFLIFKPGSRLPGYVNFLGKTLSSAVFALLVIYCLKDVAWLAAPHGVPELVAVAAVIGLQQWRHNVLLSIGVSTVLYMYLVQIVFG